MGRRAVIIGRVLDCEGDPWDIKEFRPTGHGWMIAIGWPSGLPRGKGGCGGPRVILTRELVDHLESVKHALNPTSAARLPVGRPTMKRLRRLLGHNRKDDRRSWWEAHAEELYTTSFVEFGRRHGVTSSAAELMHEELFGRKRGRPTGWWSEPEAAPLLLSNLPTVEIADRLGRSVKEIWSGRYLLKTREKEV
jgi:hypothetical protein